METQCVTIPILLPCTVTEHSIVLINTFATQILHENDTFEHNFPFLKQMCILAKQKRVCCKVTAI